MNLKARYERALSAVVQERDVQRQAAGVYVSTKDNVMWKGLAVSLVLRPTKLSILPSLVVYCPVAYKKMRAVFSELGVKDFETGAISRRLGTPFVTRPLYIAVNNQSSSQRSSVTYDIDSEAEIERSVSLLVKDFTSVQAEFFSLFKEISDLLSFFSSSNLERYPLAAVNAMALAYEYDPQISVEKLRNLRDIYPSPIADRFADLLEQELQLR